MSPSLAKLPPPTEPSATRRLQLLAALAWEMRQGLADSRGSSGRLFSEFAAEVLAAPGSVATQVGSAAPPVQQLRQGFSQYGRLTTAQRRALVETTTAWLNSFQARGGASVGTTAELPNTADPAAKQPSSVAVQTFTEQSPTPYSSRQHGTQPLAPVHQGQRRQPPNTAITQLAPPPQSPSQHPPVPRFAGHTTPQQQHHEQQTHQQQTSPGQPSSASASAGRGSPAQVSAPQSGGSWLKLPPSSLQPQPSPERTTTPWSAGESRTTSQQANGVTGQGLTGHGLTSVGRQEQQQMDQLHHQAQLWIQQQKQRVQQQSTVTPQQRSTGMPQQQNSGAQQQQSTRMLQQQGTGTPGSRSSPAKAARAQAQARPVTGTHRNPATTGSLSGLERTPLPPMQPILSNAQRYSRQQQPSVPPASTSHPSALEVPAQRQLWQSAMADSLGSLRNTPPNTAVSQATSTPGITVPSGSPRAGTPGTSTDNYWRQQQSHPSPLDKRQQQQQQHARQSTVPHVGSPTSPAPPQQPQWQQNQRDSPSGSMNPTPQQPQLQYNHHLGPSSAPMSPILQQQLQQLSSSPLHALMPTLQQQLQALRADVTSAPMPVEEPISDEEPDEMVLVGTRLVKASTVRMNAMFAAAAARDAAASKQPRSSQTAMASGEQRTQEWLNMRENRLTASSFTNALGFFPTGRHDVWEEKLGLKPKFAGNVATVWGTRQEPIALQHYEAVTGQSVEACRFRVMRNDEVHGWLGASPDGLIEGLETASERGGGTGRALVLDAVGLPVGMGPGVLEVKCPFKRQEAPPSAPPFYYMPQMQGLMDIFDREWCDAWIWTPKGARLFRIARDRHYWRCCYQALADFWWHYLVPAKHAISAAEADAAAAGAGPLNPLQRAAAAEPHRPPPLRTAFPNLERDSKAMAADAPAQYFPPWQP